MQFDYGLPRLRTPYRDRRRLLSEPMTIYSAFSPDVIVNVLRLDYVRGFVEMQ